MMFNLPTLLANVQAARNSIYKILGITSVNVRNFGAVGDGVTDDLAAFQAAIDSVPSGTKVKIIVPGGSSGAEKSYVLSSAINNNGRIPFFELEPGASIVGGASSKFPTPSRWTEYRSNGTRAEYSNQDINSTALSFASHELIDMTRPRGGAVGQGVRWNYNSEVYGSGFEIGHTILATFDRTTGDTGGSGLSQWLVAISPQVGDVSTKWNTFVAEWNVVNRHADHGWSKRRTPDNWCGIFQMVPEAQLFNKPGTTAYNILFSLGFFPSASNKTGDGLQAAAYNCILAEANCVAPGGYFAYVAGNSRADAGLNPVAAFALDDKWNWGFKTNLATIVNQAFALGTGQKIGWLNSSDVLIGGMEVASTGSIALGIDYNFRGVTGQRVWSVGKMSVAGDKQRREIQLYRSQANPSGHKLTVDGGTGNATNQILVANNSVLRIKGNVVARTTGGVNAGWSVDILAKRDATAATTTILSSTITKDTSDAGAADWVVAASADTSNGTASITITGTGTIICFADLIATELVA